MAELFVIGDGDRIRQSVDRLLLSGDVHRLKAFSSSIVAAVSSMRDRAEKELGADVVIAGGDDILFSCCETRLSREVLSELGASFREATCCTMSFGVGPTLETAYLNLRRAKSKGGDAIVGATESHAGKDR